MKKFLVFSSGDTDYEQATVTPDTMTKIQDIDLFRQSPNKRYFATRIYCKTIVFLFYICL